MAAEAPFQETLVAVGSLVPRSGVLPVEIAKGQPMRAGCLLVKMRESYERVGGEVQGEIDRAKQEALSVYEHWVMRAIEKGDFTADMSPRLAATYIDAQLNNALSLMARGEPSQEVAAILTVAFSVLR